MKKNPFQFLTEKIGYTFRDPHILELAFHHRSSGENHNERLEFLGDSILGFVITHILFTRFPQVAEGVLSRWRSLLVNQETLAALAKELKLGSVIVLGKGEKKCGGLERASILSDCFEALIGAIYVDSDLNTCDACIQRLFESRIAELSPSKVYKDPKSRLQELLQAQQLPLPQYHLLSVSGPEHRHQFVIECKVMLLEHPVCGGGPNRRSAEQDAAMHVLQELGYDE
jgi:ribonuclease III